jgi:hypothetical protein
MNRRVISVLIVAFACVLIAKASDASPNPYRSIALRNLFRLKPPSPVQRPEQPVEPLPTIVLTGITTILGDARALLEITPASKSSQKVQPKPCVLTKGQHEGEVEVIEIDPKAEFVKVSCAGKVITLTFENNGRKAVAQPLPQRGPQPKPQFPVRYVTR